MISITKLLYFNCILRIKKENLSNIKLYIVAPTDILIIKWIGKVHPHAKSFNLSYLSTILHAIFPLCRPFLNE